MITYKSVDDLNRSLVRNLQKFPRDIDVVVGIPRSGMLPANLLALYLNKPFVDLDSFLQGRRFGIGDRGQFVAEECYGKALVIDDSIASGVALRRAREKIEQSQVAKDYSIIYAVVYATTQSAHHVDVCCEIVDGDRIFQWNLFHHPYFIQKSCFDIDGVLCENPTVDDDGPLYEKHLTQARALYVPTVEIDTLVTCRLEKYRKLTESWLQTHNVKYRHLVMLDLPDKAARIKWNQHGVFKGQLYKKSDALIFVESSLHEAEVIQRVSGKPVFCTETFTLLQSINRLFFVRRVVGRMIRTLHLYWFVRLARKALRRA